MKPHTSDNEQEYVFFVCKTCGAYIHPKYATATVSANGQWIKVDYMDCDKAMKKIAKTVMEQWLP
jgi:hypothetical protein